MPAAARIADLPSPNGSHAKPTRGEMWLNDVEIMPRPTPLSPGNSWPFGAAGVTVDCWLGINDAVLSWASTGGVSMSHRSPRLAVHRGVPRAQMRGISRVLLKCAGLAGDKVRNRITRAGGRGGREGNVAIIIQIGLEHGLVESELTAKGKVVLALGH